jgi:hypothetical protein
MKRSIINFIKNYYFILVLIQSLTLSSSCKRIKNSEKREPTVVNEVREDSLLFCKRIKSIALEQVKRGNLVLYRDFKDYLHAKEYFFDKYDIILLPEIENNICAKKVMDSVIFSRYGKEFILEAVREISEIYKTIPDNQYLDGSFAITDKLPVYPGGIDSLYCDIYSSVNNCRVCDINYEFGNEIIVAFIIDSNGYIRNPHIIQKLCPEVDKEIIDAIKHLKKWSPPILDNKRVAYFETLSIDWKKEDIQICRHQ